ncbi:uncharacterized protein LOC121297859 [Polyodon spathula]|uniref:uncharacterized protein LOC121297859 n=1 Tax=Polyodon spathula TaxID=7913 RepID=UPI001B7D9305|nr:uncharacterized protein LOC121297859 [Polyodon spathula]
MATGINSNCTFCCPGYGAFLGSYQLWVVVAVIGCLLILSLCLNILCYLSQYTTGGGNAFLPRFRRSFSLKLKDMEENPIYGNINYTQGRTEFPLNSSSTNSQQQQKTNPQVDSRRRQDCYANLQLKAPKPQSGRSSPQIQYSDVVTLPRVKLGPESGWSQNQEPTHPAEDTTSLHSDLYASVESERVKAISENKDYANRI